jgi:hypothetical protein
MNPEKMRRQSSQFLAELIQTWDTVSSGTIQSEVGEMDSDWATPILVHLWSMSLVEAHSALVELRPAAKRALIELRSRGANGPSRSHAQLTQLLAACQNAIDEYLRIVELEFA